MKLSGKFGCKDLYGASKNGPFWLKQPDEQQIKILDNHPQLQRFQPLKLKWWLIPPNTRPFKELKNRYKESIIMVIGRGPSLDSLTFEDVENLDVIIACNSAVKPVCDLGHPNTYNVQCDPGAGCNYDKRSTPVIIVNSSHFYMDAHILYIPHPNELPIKRWHPVGCMGIGLAKYLGAKKILLCGFDGAFGGSLKYATCAAKHINKMYTNPSRFRQHKKPMLAALKGCDWEILKTK